MLKVPFRKKIYCIKKELLVEIVKRFDKDCYKELTGKDVENIEVDIDIIAESYDETISFLKKLKLYDEDFLKNVNKIEKKRRNRA